MTGRRRGRHEGTIHKRKDGRWVAAVDLGWQGGRRQRKYVYGRTRDEVRRKLGAAQSAVEAGAAPGPERLKVGAYLDEWLDQARLRVRPRTWQRYEQYVRLHAKPSLARVNLVKLAPEHLTRLYSNRLEAKRVLRRPQ
jgi:integrase